MLPSLPYLHSLHMKSPDIWKLWQMLFFIPQIFDQQTVLLIFGCDSSEFAPNIIHFRCCFFSIFWVFFQSFICSLSKFIQTSKNMFIFIVKRFNWKKGANSFGISNSANILWPNASRNIFVDRNHSLTNEIIRNSWPSTAMNYSKKKRERVVIMLVLSVCQFIDGLCKV